jgi:hypothetical protein
LNDFTDPSCRDQFHQDVSSEILITDQKPIKRRTLIHIDEEEINTWINSYQQDDQILKILKEMKNEKEPWNPRYPHYQLGDNALLYFEGWEGNLCLYVPKSMRSRVLKEDHESLMEGAHSGGLRSYYRLSNTYYWPHMLRDVHKYASTCDICQKVKPKRHAPVGMLNPLPIPARPFDTITYLNYLRPNQVMITS